MSLVKVVALLSLIAVLVFAAMPAPTDAGCACSGIGQSNGYYATSPIYGSYGYGYGQSYVAPGQPQVQPVRPKAKKAKNKASKNKPATQ
jgi:hypothetical protein